MTIPSFWPNSAPWPLPKMSGKLITSTVSVVMMMGRKRSRAASIKASLKGICFDALDHEIQVEDRVLRREADQHEHPQQAEDVQAAAERPDQPQGAGKGERHGQKEVDGIAPRVELSAHDEVGEEEREEECDRGLAGQLAGEVGRAEALFGAEADVSPEDPEVCHLRGDDASGMRGPPGHPA